MYGIPEPLIIDEGEQEKLVASVSVSLEPPKGSGGPFFSVSYEISLRVFCIALALSRLEKSMKGEADNSDDKQGNKEQYSPDEARKEKPDMKDKPRSEPGKSGVNAASKDED